VNERYYRTLRNRIAIYPFGVVIGLLGLILAGATSAPIALRIFGAMAIPIAVIYTRRGLRLGIRLNESEVVVYAPFRTLHVQRADVAGVGLHKWFANWVVHIELRDGRRIETNLIEGALVTWKDGKTKHILVALEHELGALPPTSSSTSHDSCQERNSDVRGGHHGSS
jgi:hypothetical protein